MAIDVSQWLYGFGVSLILGGIVTPVFLFGLRKYRKVKKDNQPDRWSPDWWSPYITGTVERGFFTVAIAANLPGAVVAMVAWIAVKMATHWNRMSKDGYDKRQVDLAWTALLAGLVSGFINLVSPCAVRITAEQVEFPCEGRAQ